LLTALKIRQLQWVPETWRYQERLFRVSNADEMRLEIFVMHIHFPAAGIFHPQRGQGADDDQRLAANVLAADLRHFANVEHPPKTVFTVEVGKMLVPW